MRHFTQHREMSTPDELWVLQHPPTYTLGLSGHPEHLLDEVPIPLIHTDRGGLITYHGPGQVIIYVLLDLTRRHMKVRELVYLMEEAIIRSLQTTGIHPERRPGAPGVYVKGAKIASLGLRIRRGCSYHGLSLNGQMDLAPFSHIHPCGFPELPITSTAALGLSLSTADLEELLLSSLQQQLGPS